MNLNEKELEVLEAVKAEIISQTGNEFGFTDSIGVEDLTKNQVAGYLSQLVQKGYISVWDDFDGMVQLRLAAKEILTGVENFEFADER